LKYSRVPRTKKKMFNILLMIQHPRSLHSFSGYCGISLM
jgi:hypothetical protein